MSRITRKIAYLAMITLMLSAIITMMVIFSNNPIL